MIISNIQFLRKSGKYLLILLLSALCFSLIIHRAVYTFHFIAMIVSLICYFSVSGFYSSTKNNSDKIFKIKLFLLTLIFGIVFLFVVGYIASLVVGAPFVGLDDVNYHSQQLEIVQKIKYLYGMSLNSFMTGDYSGYPNLGALVMYYTGSTEWYIPRLFTVLLMAVSALVIYGTLKDIYDVKTSRLMSTIFALTPIFSFYAVLQLKDYVIIFFLLLIFRAVVNIYKKKQPIGSVFLFCLPLFGLLFFRPAIIFTVLCAFFAFGLTRLRVNRIGSMIGFTVISIIIVLILNSGWNNLSEIGLSSNYNDYLDPRIENALSGTKTINQSSSIASSKLVQIAGAPFYAAISPFLPIPNTVLFVNPLYPSLNFEFTSNIYLYSLLPFLIGVLVYMFRHRKEFTIEWFFVIFFFVYKLGQSTSMSVFGLRQSLPGILCIMFLLPIIFKKNIPEKYFKWAFIILLLLLFSWSFIRQSFR